MSYVVLARKYRPRSFSQMVGQEHVVQALSNALKQGRLHHAYLFTGTRGIGKTTVSRILAKSLNCTGPDGNGGITDQPCGVCQACTEIDADRYIDYIELDAASNRGIDEVRDLLERAAYKPSIGRFKVFMIDEAHQLTKESFNALLKTLEEPPEYLKFVLATTDPQKMLPTVLSRCLQFNLRPMAPETVREHLQNVLQAEQVAWDEGSLRLLSRAARGSMRDALSLTDQAIAYGGGQLDEAVVRAMLGTVDRSHAQKLVQALAQRDGVDLLKGIDALRGAGLSAAGTLEEMAALLQQMAVAQAVPGALDERDPEASAALALADQLAPDETQLLYSIVLHGRAELNLASDEYAALTMVLLRLLAFPPAGGGGPTGNRVAPPPRVERAPAREAAPSGMTRSGPTPAVTSSAAAASTPEDPVTSAAPAPAAAVATTPTGAAPLQRSVPARQVVQPGAFRPATNDAGPSAPRAAGQGDPPRPLRAPPVPAPATPTSRPVAPVRAEAAEELPPWLDAPPPGEEFGAAAGDLAVLERPATRSTVTAHERVADVCEDESNPAPAAAAESPSWQVERTALGDRWSEVIAQLNERGAITALVRELAQQAELVQVSGPDTAAPVWRLRVERDTLRTPALKDKLQAAIAALVQPAPVLEVEAGVAQDSPARRDVETRERRQRQAEDIIRNDPVVRDLMAQFRTARIVPGSIKPV